MLNQVRRGDIYYADLSTGIGSEQGGIRPVLIVQNDVGNKYSPTVIAASITSKLDKTKLPTHTMIEADMYGLPRNSIVLCEQIKTLDKTRLKSFVSTLDNNKMSDVDEAIAISFGLVNAHSLVGNSSR